MSLPTVQTEPITLVSVSGPTSITLPLTPPGPITLGRAMHQTVELADPRVSREHAVLSCSDPRGRDLPPRWMIADNGSRHGTWVNGGRLAPGRAVPLRNGDLLVIGPWTFRIQGGEPGSGIEVSLAALSDVAEGTITRVETRGAETLAQERLALLLECATAIHLAADEKALAEAVLEAAVSGTGFANAAMLRSITEGDQVEILAHRGAILAGGQPRLSRSLVRQAAEGVPARLERGGSSASTAHSLIELNIGEALCIPLMLENTAAGFIYLDHRGTDALRRRVFDDAADYAAGLARVASLALANLRRLDVERRHARMQAELSAAGRMQGMLLPPREGSCGIFAYTGESRPGRYVGGDFFDVIPLADGRLAVALGDVAGKGVEASVLITASQGFLHAALQQHGDVGRALTDLNRYVHPRCPLGKFITMWVGVFDGAGRTVECVDAGHGHAVFALSDGSFMNIGSEKHFPIGIIEDTVYTAERVPLPEGGRALVLSDGLLEEPAPGGRRAVDGHVEQFSMEGVRAALASMRPGEDEVSALFRAIHAYAGQEALQDDATAVVVRWARQ